MLLNYLCRYLTPRHETAVHGEIRAVGQLWAAVRNKAVVCLPGAGILGSLLRCLPLKGVQRQFNAGDRLNSMKV